MPGPSDLRASDAERDRVVVALREHAGEGRLTMEELDERCSAALSARTRGELSALLHDLPESPAAPTGLSVPAAPPVLAAPPAAAPRQAKGVGVRPFTYEWHHRVAPATAMDEALRHLAPALHRLGYELAAKTEHRLVFTYSHRPAWTFGVAILLFPVGLLALLHTHQERVVLDFDPAPGGGTRLVASGRAPRRVRRAFAELVL